MHGSVIRKYLLGWGKSGDESFRPASTGVTAGEVLLVLKLNFYCIFAFLVIQRQLERNACLKRLSNIS
jgi:hypothetical protein